MAYININDNKKIVEPDKPSKYISSENIGIIDEKLVVLLSNVFCRISSYVLTYPFLRFHIQSQVPLHYSDDRFSFFVSNLYDFLILSKSEGMQLLWRGCPGFIILSEATNLIFHYTEGLLERLSKKSIFNPILVLLFECLGTVILSSFYTAVIIDSVLSTSVTGSRSVLFVFSLALERVLGKKLRFNRSSTLFISPQFPSLFHISFGLILQLVTKKVATSILNSLYYIYDKFKRKKNDDSLIPRTCRNMYQDLISWNISDLIALPLTVSTIKLCLQGYGVVIDSVNHSSKFVVENSFAAPTFHKNFFQCFLSTYDDYGILGFFSGFSYFLTTIAIRCGIVYIVTKILNFYNRKNLKID